MTTSPQSQTKFIAFFDECGDHSLEKIDNDFPIFILSTVVVERENYLEKIIPSLAKLKLKFWDHEGVNLHSRDIRKALGDFTFMQIPQERKTMINELELMIQNLPFTLFLTVIDKEKHKNQHGINGLNPYNLALGHTLFNLEEFLNENNEDTLPIIAESRGKNEDDQLKASFYEFKSSNSQFQLSNFPLTFRRKNDNIAGIQIADLCAYPAARRFLNPDKENRAFDVIRPHIYKHQVLPAIK